MANLSIRAMQGKAAPFFSSLMNSNQGGEIRCSIQIRLLVPAVYLVTGLHGSYFAV